MSHSDHNTLFPKISNKITNLTRLLSVRRRRPNSADSQTFELIGTVKLHGTHADILIDNKNYITLQSRNRTGVTPENDIHGFAAWAADHSNALLQLKKKVNDRLRELNFGSKCMPRGPLVLAGEWIGEKVQRQVAISYLSRRFVLINISLNGGDEWVRIEEFANIADEAVGFYNILRGGTFRASVTLSNAKEDMKRIQAVADKVEKECPFAKTFGINGMGEGIVWKVIGYEHDARYWLKTKGPISSGIEPQSVPHPKTPIKRPLLSGTKKTKRAKATAFVKSVVHEKRLQQGWEYLDEMGIDKDEKGFLAYIKWLQHDVLLEEKWEIAELRLERAIVKRVIAGLGARYYSQRVEEEEEEEEEVDEEDVDRELEEDRQEDDDDENDEGFW